MARAWLAERLGCQPSELVVEPNRGDVDRNGREDHIYRRATAYAGRIIVSRPHVQGSRNAYRTVTGAWPGGSTSFRIAADESVEW